MVIVMLSDLEFYNFGFGHGIVSSVSTGDDLYVHATGELIVQPHFSQGFSGALAKGFGVPQTDVFAQSSVSGFASVVGNGSSFSSASIRSF
jgi:hypothetical protein